MKLLLLSAAAALLFVISAQTNAQADSSSLSGAAAVGEQRFHTYCSSCHGLDARGGGPTAKSLKTPPPNLRHISQRNGSTFPKQRVEEIIDGRFAVSEEFFFAYLPDWPDKRRQSLAPK